MCYFISHTYMWQLCTFWNIGKVSTIFRSEVTIFGRIAMGNYRPYTLLYRAMSSYALANSWRNFAATARQIGALDGEAADKCGRITHIVATAIWSDDITYYIILYGLKIMKWTMDRRTNERTDGRMEGQTEDTASYRVACRD